MSKILPIREPQRSLGVEFTGANDYLLCDVGSVVTQMPFTLVTWFLKTGNADPNRFGLYSSASGSSFAELQIFSDGRINARLNARNCLTSATYEVNKWNLAVGVFASNTLRRAYLNGPAGRGTSTNNETLVAPDRMSIGRRYDASPGDGNEGHFALTGVYAGTLSDSDVTALWNNGNGCDLRRIKPDLLRAMWTLNGTYEDTFGSPFRWTPYGGTKWTQVDVPLNTRGRTSYFPMPAAPPPPTRRMKIITFRHPVGVV